MGPLGEAGGHHSVTALDRHLKLNMIAFYWVGKRDLLVQPAFHIVSHRSSSSGLSDSNGSLNIGGDGDPRSPFLRFTGLCSTSKNFGGVLKIGVVQYLAVLSVDKPKNFGSLRLGCFLYGKWRLGLSCSFFVRCVTEQLRLLTMLSVP
jgi:hypothetical protein